MLLALLILIGEGRLCISPGLALMGTGSGECTIGFDGGFRAVRLRSAALRLSLSGRSAGGSALPISPGLFHDLGILGGRPIRPGSSSPSPMVLCFGISSTSSSPFEYQPPESDEKEGIPRGFIQKSDMTSFRMLRFRPVNTALRLSPSAPLSQCMSPQREPTRTFCGAPWSLGAAGGATVFSAGVGWVNHDTGAARVAVIELNRESSGSDFSGSGSVAISGRPYGDLDWLRALRCICLR